MPDIMMCEGKECPLKNQCYRHRAVPDEYWQSWAENGPYDKEKNECTWFMEIGTRKVRECQEKG